MLRYRSRMAKLQSLKKDTVEDSVHKLWMRREGEKCRVLQRRCETWHGDFHSCPVHFGYLPVVYHACWIYYVSCCGHCSSAFASFVPAYC